jgi:hypothetical protein
MRELMNTHEVADYLRIKERKIYDNLDQDMQETWAVTGVYPNMGWTADSRDVVFWAGGKIKRIPASGGQAQVIPFRIQDDRVVATYRGHGHALALGTDPKALLGELMGGGTVSRTAKPGR